MFIFFVAEDGDECLKKRFHFALLMEINGFTHKSSSSIEDFQVEDLLDLTGLSEPEKEEEEEENLTKNELEFSAFEKEKTCSSQLYEITFCEETDAADLEWLSCFIEDCNSYEYPDCNFTMKQTPFLLSSAYKNHKRKKRSKRHRRSSGLWSVPRTSPVSSINTTAISSSSPSCSCSSSSSYMFYDPFPSPSNPFPSPSNIYMAKKRGRKPKIFTGSSGDGGSSGERRCVHCGVQKTPQWRTGPNGPKTLCNACGVRFKSGRLLPEYRPACSPTFVGSVHSNSHRKVLEMRRKKEVQLYSVSAPAVQSC